MNADDIIYVILSSLTDNSENKSKKLLYKYFLPNYRLKLGGYNKYNKWITNKFPGLINTINIELLNKFKEIDECHGFFIISYLNKNKKSYEMMFWRYYCCSFPGSKLLVLEDKEISKKDEKNCLYEFHQKISENAYDGIKLQIMFSQMMFNDIIEYLFKNSDKYKNTKLDAYNPAIMHKELHIYVMKKIEGKYDPLYESHDFYELVEGSKIFLHFNNYEFYEEQLKYAFGNKLKDTIRIFFLLKFLKIYLYKKKSFDKNGWTNDISLCKTQHSTSLP
jgi:hypothetical protein